MATIIEHKNSLCLCRLHSDTFYTVFALNTSSLILLLSYRSVATIIEHKNSLCLCRLHSDTFYTVFALNTSLKLLLSYRSVATIIEHKNSLCLCRLHSDTFYTVFALNTSLILLVFYRSVATTIKPKNSLCLCRLCIRIPFLLYLLSILEDSVETARKLCLLVDAEISIKITYAGSLKTCLRSLRTTKEQASLCISADRSAPLLHVSSLFGKYHYLLS